MPRSPVRLSEGDLAWFDDAYEARTSLREIADGISERGYPPVETRFVRLLAQSRGLTKRSMHQPSESV